ncbi:MAG TPA: hypothetical protein P5513_05425 [Candidatus Diapherotrites archaeon]|nr:hypothetical protein [Candidatus Diapherotrites archaeon]
MKQISNSSGKYVAYINEANKEVRDLQGKLIGKIDEKNIIYDIHGNYFGTYEENTQLVLVRDIELKKIKRIGSINSTQEVPNTIRIKGVRRIIPLGFRSVFG